MPRAPELPQVDTGERLLAQLARADDVEGQTQEQVAGKPGATRLRVNKALSDARDRGPVRFGFSTAYAACAAPGAALCARRGLRRAPVAPAPVDDRDVRTVTGAALGHLLAEVLADPALRLSGMSRGGTLNVATRLVGAPDRPDLEVTSVRGGLAEGSDLNSLEITTRLADLTGGRHCCFTAPVSAGSRETIMGPDVFRDVIARLRRVDAIAIAAGDLSRRSLPLQVGQPRDVSARERIAPGGVGAIPGTVIDAEGGAPAHPPDARVIGTGLDDPGPIADVILAAGGLPKVPVVRAALRRGVVKTLATGKATARALPERGA